MDHLSHTHEGHDHSHEHGNSAAPMETSAPKSNITESDAIRRKSVLRKLTVASVLCATFLLVEVIGGLISGSLAILSDAAHLLADLASFCVAIAAAHLASLPASETHTFGLRRTEALAALFSMASLAIISCGLTIEAIRRLWPMILGWFGGSAKSNIDVVDVDGKLMTLIALIGVAVNVCLALVLGEHHVHLPGADHGHSHSHSHSHGHGHGQSHSQDDENEITDMIENEETSLLPLQHPQATSDAHHVDELTQQQCHSHEKERNINLHAAYLHVLGDLAQSVAVAIAGLIIWAKPTYAAADPICTIFFAILVFYSTIGVIRSSISVLLEEVPPSVSWLKVYDTISSVHGVSNVHDLHIWSISHGEPALSVHVNASHPEKALEDIHKVCQQLKIRHSTIQVQPSTIPDCITCNDGMLLCR
uniref:Cation efflux protein cytoplasmic domain-containing protein n=1 Tax=Odontella aurita TaxID=265563 RepID=A0A7S4HR36_9STRA|mmetsp:Transcript_13905/g.40677  ORF Transcript_13905/g.40677 Transcript_13905/m.40677 type:complete len:420 (+) Transcript_13905:798-2057(+)